MNPYETDILIIGGGLAGLTNAIQLKQAGFDVCLVEKKQYPLHRVCGEYISNEVLPFLQSLGLNPFALGASSINRLQVSSPTGNSVTMNLDLGGFGLSRYVLDEYLYKLACKVGVQFMLGKSAETILFKENRFEVQLTNGQILESSLVIGAFGKRSKLDKNLNREFIRHRSPYIGVKYHIRTDFPKDLIALHNFKDGYCGVCAIEENKYNICYLTTRDHLKAYGSIEEMEANTLYKNPFMKALRTQTEFLYEKPEVINEISFAPKNAVENHILMSGDTAGLITPLCGNGMAMAIHSAKILSDLIIRYKKEAWSRNQLEKMYTHEWNHFFNRRLWVGRQTQRLFGNEWLSELAVRVLRTLSPAARLLMKQTHGSVF